MEEAPHSHGEYAGPNPAGRIKPFVWRVTKQNGTSSLKFSNDFRKVWISTLKVLVVLGYSVRKSVENDGYDPLAFDHFPTRARLCTAEIRKVREHLK